MAHLFQQKDKSVDRFKFLASLQSDVTCFAEVNIIRFNTQFLPRNFHNSHEVTSCVYSLADLSEETVSRLLRGLFATVAGKYEKGIKYIN